jgi:hypothetical protein
MASKQNFKVVTHEGKIVVTQSTGHRYEFFTNDNDLTHVLVTPNQAASEHVSMFEEEARKLARERLDGKDEN